MGIESYDRVLGRAKALKKERDTLAAYLNADETVLARSLAEALVDTTALTATRRPLPPLAVPVVEAEGAAELMTGGVVLVITDRKLIAATSTGGFRPRWEALTLPYGQLEPELREVPADGGSTVLIVPTSGRRDFGARFRDAGPAADCAAALREALGTYRRERMGL
ncbi:hypothetical protein J2S58_002143 [Nakamurella flavida]|uniref:hypothetical protein n=1 Tax=Nakamurella flavida TaxID=363630 RepID=UPI00277F4E7E|nr:hypothetical protein [Nakamurella flavida]MDP9778520.1 hypothetical protein [Nakamurella flavida]